MITPGGNPTCSECGHWYGPGEKHTCVFVARHNHLTRDIKAEGLCPACDRHWEAARR